MASTGHPPAGARSAASGHSKGTRAISTAPQPILRDGRAEFVIHLGHGFARVDEGAMQPQPLAIFAGQLERPLSLQPTGRVAVLGVRFRPEGAARFTRVPQHELVGQTVDVALASPTLAGVARRVRDSAATLHDAVRLLERLLDGVERHHGVDHRVASVVEAISRRSGRVSIERAAADPSASSRKPQVEPRTWNSEPRTQHLEPRTRNLEPGT